MANNNNPKYFLLDYTHEELVNILERAADCEGVSEERVQELINAAQFGDADFSGYALITYVDEQIANIKLLEGPMGPQGPQGEMGPQGEAGKDFTFEMFTPEQLEMLVGPQGEAGPIGPEGPQGMQGEQGPQGEVGPMGPQGIQGEPGKDGITPVKGEDYFTAEDIAALNIPSIEGLATEAYVQNKIAEAQLNNDGEVNLEGLATKDELNAKADKTELVGLATETFVNNAVAAVELKEGPMGPAGAAFTYDMFTEEQLEALRGPEGPAGKDGVTPIKGEDYFTAEDIAALNIPSIEGLATEIYVQNKIAEAQLNGGDNEVNLEGLATKDELKLKADKSELVGLATEIFVNEAVAAVQLKEGPIGPEGPKGEDGAAFTYDMFTPEQLEALRGPAGTDGAAGPAGADGKDFTYDMFTEEQLKALIGPQGPEGIQGPVGPQGEQGEQGPQGEIGPQGPEGLKGETGEQGPAGADGKDFTYDMFTPEQLEALRGPQGEQGPEGPQGPAGADGADGAQGEQGPAGQDGAQGVSVVSMVIDENNHLMVTLSNDQVLDAGEVPVGSGGEGGGADAEEVEAMKTELAKTKQELLDLTYGVEYEWIYFYDQPTSATMALGFDRATAPKFYEDVDAAIEAGDAEYESFLYSMYEQDIYRMYVLKLVADHKVFNRYELLPIEGSTAQPANTYIPTWNPVKGLTGWNVDTETDTNGFTLTGSSAPTSAMTVAFMKVKEEYRGKF